MKEFQYFENYQNMMPRHEVSKCCWNNGAYIFAWSSVATNLWFVRHTIFEKPNKTWYAHILNYPEGLITRALRREEGGRRERTRDSIMRVTQCNIAGFVDGGRGWEGEERGQPLEGGKGKKQITCYSLQKVCSPADTLVLAQSDLVWTSDLWDSRITKQCCFLSLSVCGHLFQQQWWINTRVLVLLLLLRRCSCVWLCAISDYFVCIEAWG